MYLPASQITGLPIIGLQSSDTVAWIRQPVIDIANLEAVAFTCETINRPGPVIMVTRDIRQFAGDCVIIDSEDELAEPDDIIRLKDFLRDAYTPNQKTVVTDTGRHLGQVEDYTLNIETYRIQKLFVRQSLLRSWLGSNLTIDRTQIIDVTPRRITVRDTSLKVPAMHPDAVPDSSS